MDLDSIISELKREQERIGRAIAALLPSSLAVTGRRRGRPPKASSSRKRGTTPGGITTEGRRRLSLAMRRRWASGKMKKASAPGTSTVPTPKKRGLSAAGRKRISEMMKKRWAERRAKAAKV